MSLNRSNENDIFIKPSQSYDVKLRPKRDIDFKKISPELLKRIEALDPNDESDEDFIPDDDDDSLNVSKGSDDDDDDEDEDEETDGSDNENDNNNLSNDDNKNNSGINTSENDSDLESKSDKVTLKNGKHKLSSNLDNGVNKKKIRKSLKANKSIGDGTKPEAKVKNPKTKPKKRVKKKINKNFESDEETQKLMQSFKCSKIVRKDKKSLNTSTSKTHLNGINVKQENNHLEPVKLIHQNTGPYAKRTKQSIQLKNTKDTITYPIYLVCQHSSSTNSENKMNDELNNHLNRNKLVVKETIPPIIDKSSSTWICALCNNKPNQINGLGELYGPYRVSLCLDEDLIYEKNNTGIYLCYLIQCYSF